MQTLDIPKLYSGELSQREVAAKILSERPPYVKKSCYFEPKESYKHKLAKNLLATWLREQDEQNEFPKVAQFSWRRSYGVFEELIFYSDSDEYYFENPKFNTGYPLFVPDITVFHKGSIVYLFEIVHTNKVSQVKIDLIRKYLPSAELYEVSANEILRHDSATIPSHIKCKRLIQHTNHPTYPYSS